MDPHDKALELFVSYLSTEQLQSFQEHMAISCIGNITKEVYRMECSGVSISHNIRDSRYVSYCIVPEGHSLLSMPIFDTLLSQKLVIENDEELFLKTAFRAQPPTIFHREHIEGGVDVVNFFVPRDIIMRDTVERIVAVGGVENVEVAAPVESPRPDAFVLLVWAIYVPTALSLLLKAILYCLSFVR